MNKKKRKIIAIISGLSMSVLLMAGDIGIMADGQYSIANGSINFLVSLSISMIAYYKFSPLNIKCKNHSIGDKCLFNENGTCSKKPCYFFDGKWRKHDN